MLTGKAGFRWCGGFRSASFPAILASPAVRKGETIARGGIGPLRLERRSMSNPAFKFDHVHIISENPHASAEWYVEMFGATIAADTVARGAPQIFVDLGGMTILIRGRRPGEDPAPVRPIRPYADFSSHNGWGTDHFGFIYQGDLAAFCAELRAKGVTFPVELKKGVGGSLLCYVAAPDGVSIELMQC
jgi:catechol 2,3-dioxygenase-like lactoylglutathione lyase family enzyme